jgi:hypothetical protein
VHFAFIDRSRGQICTPTLVIDDPQQLGSNNPTDESESILEKKVENFLSLFFLIFFV